MAYDQLHLETGSTRAFIEGAFCAGAQIAVLECSCGEFPLSKRGWVLQERMLSSRVLFWTQDALFWECPETHASEYESECATFIETPLPLLSEVISYMGEGSWQRRYDRKGWIDILTEYSSKRLTQQTDKLPAVKGIANRIASANPGQEYCQVCGARIWCHSLPGLPTTLASNRLRSG